MTEDATTWTWMSDDPLETPSSDPRSPYFDRTAFVATTADAIRAAAGQSKSSVFGLIGSWGSGKTSIISSLTAQLTASNWRVHHFNPWLYSDADSLRWGFFSELRGAVPAGDRWNDTRKNLEMLRYMVLPLAKLVGLLGRDTGDAASQLLHPGRLSASKMREKVSSQLEGLVEPILVVLDDLDRLTSSELLEVFKLVRFIGRLPNVYYLLCYDEKTLIDLLEKTDLVGERNDRRALDYLEKIVQLRFDVPPLRADLVEALFETALRGVVAKSGVTLTSIDETRLVELLRSGLIERLSTPRAIRHLFAQLEAFLPSVANEVDPVDFVLLSWIRTFEPGLYGQLQSQREFLSHGDVGLEFDSAKVLQKRKTRLSEMLDRGDVSPANTATVLRVLQALFPVIGRIIEDQGTSNLPRLAPRRIADAFYFDRYFNFGVPEDDLHDATVRAALLGLGKEPTASMRSLELHLASDTKRTIQKVERERERTPDASADLARWTLGQFARLPEQNGWGAPKDLLTGFLAEVLVDVGPQTDRDLVREATIAGTESTYRLLDATRFLAGRQLGSGDEIALWNRRGKELQTEILSQLPAYVAKVAVKPVFEVAPFAWPLLLTWGTLDGDGAASFIRERIDAGTWPVLDVAARLVGSVVPSGSGPDAVSSISEFDESLASNYIDLTKVRAHLAAQIANAGDLESLYRAEATPENRRAYVLAWLKAHPMVNGESDEATRTE